ncbi:cupin domain-containing protein [Pedobacter jejuensis]|uniref:Cupin domain-containing protein n=1 Tax=Pedobacter jejuensis TaxID=1268550 RepID=A0A3N0C257_9SPHI|nr:cupin domain-containing protein [Pedobacter jejuensis]RNL55828.1 cupin domain-containing protein [Pedobacter jejuensis]
METSTIDRRKTIQCLALLMGAAIIPDSAFGKIGYPDPEEISGPEVKKPIHIKSGNGKKGNIGDGDIIFKFDKHATDGHLGITESTLPVGILGAPPHSHKGFDEICRVTQGTLTILVGNEIFEVNEGDWHLRPKGIVHSFWNKGTKPAKFIEIYSPGGHELYMNELSDLFLNNQRPKPGSLDLLAKKYDITFDWPKLQTIMDTYQVRL